MYSSKEFSFDGYSRGWHSGMDEQYKCLHVTVKCRFVVKYQKFHLTCVCISKYEHLSSLLCWASCALNSAASLMARLI